MSQSTSVRIDDAYHPLKALLRGRLRDMKWRHHGIGALQGYVSEGANPEVRVHIWSQRLLKPGISESGDIHDHRFYMVSHVLAGTIIHEEVTPWAEADGTHVMMGLTHARAAEDTNYHGPTTPLVGRYNVRRTRWEIEAGYKYTFQVQKFHHSPIHGGPNDVAVTVIEKWDQVAEPARLLYPVGIDPVMAFGHEMDPHVVREVIELAERAISK